MQRNCRYHATDIGSKAMIALDTKNLEGLDG